MSLLAFCIVLAAIAARGDKLGHVDERVYDELATGLIEGRGYVNQGGELTSYRPPGYPFVLFSVYQLWSEPIVGRLLNAVLLGLSAGLAGVMAERVRVGSGVFAAALMGFYPLFVYTATTLYPQTLALFLVLVVLYLLLFQQSKLTLIGAALAYGLLTLAVPSFLLLLPFVASIRVFASEPGARMHSLLLALVFCVVSVAVFSPWTLRNYLVFERFIPISTNGGINLLAGNSPDAGPNTGISAHLRYRPLTAGMSEFERDNFYKQSAVEWIKENPGRAATLYLAKFANYFNFINEVAAKSENPGLAGRALLFLSYYGLLLLVLVRFKFRRSVPITFAEKVLLAGYILNGLISAVFYTRLRYRMPFDGMLFVLAGVALQQLFLHWRPAPQALGRQ